MWAQFKACPALLCIHRLQISLLYSKNSTFSWKCSIWRWNSYSNKSILQKGKIKKERDERESRKRERNKENKDQWAKNDQVGLYFQIRTADLWKSSLVWGFNSLLGIPFFSETSPQNQSALLMYWSLSSLEKSNWENMISAVDNQESRDYEWPLLALTFLDVDPRL